MRGLWSNQKSWKAKTNHHPPLSFSSSAPKLAGFQTPFRETPASHGGGLAGSFWGVFGKLQTDDGLKDFSDRPPWRCSKEEMPGDMNMLSSLLLIATRDQISKGWSLTLQSCSSKKFPRNVNTAIHCVSLYDIDDRTLFAWSLQSLFSSGRAAAVRLCSLNIALKTT